MMEDNVIYNRPDNEVMVKTQGNLIYIICKDENQVQPVLDKMSTDTCILSDYEEWDEYENMRWILTFKVIDDYNDYLNKLN